MKQYIFFLILLTSNITAMELDTISLASSSARNSQLLNQADLDKLDIVTYIKTGKDDLLSQKLKNLKDNAIIFQEQEVDTWLSLAHYKDDLEMPLRFRALLRRNCTVVPVMCITSLLTSALNGTCVLSNDSCYQVSLASTGMFIGASLAYLLINGHAYLKKSSTQKMICDLEKFKKTSMRSRASAV